MKKVLTDTSNKCPDVVSYWLYNFVQLYFVNLKLNKHSSVQECGARMMRSEQMPETKNKKLNLNHSQITIINKSQFRQC